MKVIKRDGRVVDYDGAKIIMAIKKANNEVHLNDQITDRKMKDIEQMISEMTRSQIQVEEIQDLIEHSLVQEQKYELAKKYIIYRYKHALMRKANTTDESILSLIRNDNKELAEENSNKNTLLASTQRDYIAGEVSRDLTKRVLLPDRIVEAHESGAIHFHDADYFLQPIFNCCLINIGDMLDHGTVINGKLIETPKSFRVACTVTTQIIASVASNQYGGQSVDLIHLGKYLRYSREKFRRKAKENWTIVSVRNSWNKLLRSGQKKNYRLVFRQCNIR
ncbi:Anaerobic ribonucleoside-triphosphate reductase [Eubacterium plexicaudatum ASF492]|nr:Anaerobic ribonucleoside-triphosphate reductase [Eubacterium plexicaudatum ASF492]